MAKFAAILWLALLTCSSSADKWDPVREVLRAYFPMKDMAFSAGNAQGRQFSFEKGAMTMSKPLDMASASKFPAATAVVGAVAAGHLGFDTRPGELWPWWTSEVSDPRSRVTLRHLLSFTSGFYWQDAGGELPCLAGPTAASYSPEACAREIYEKAPFEFEPGSTWAYNSLHLQIAGAMAAKASNSTVQQLLHRNLIGRLNLTGTKWLGGENPALAGTMITTGDDYDKVLRAYVAYELVPKKLADEMERDYLEGPVKVANSSAFLSELLGHYSMCTYFECLPPKLSAFTPACKAANVHVDAGLFGYYPLVDRARGTYMQIVQMKMVTSQLDFYLPTVSSMVLRKLVKPLVDYALRQPGGGDTDGARDMGSFRTVAASKHGIWLTTWRVLRRAKLAGKHRGPAEVWKRLAALDDSSGFQTMTA